MDGQAKRNGVIVFDHTGAVLLPTCPAEARRLLKAGRATLIDRNPTTIRLRYDAEETTRRNQMKTVSFTNFFKEEKDVYIQNVSGSNISMSFGTGDEMEYFSLQSSRDPVNLTNHIPFAKIKASTDFRKFVNSEPPRILVLTEPEFKAYYKEKARLYQKPQEELERDAEVQRGKHQRHEFKEPVEPASPIHQVVKDGNKRVAKPMDIVAEGETIHPRIIGICQGVSKQIPEAQWTPAAKVLAELQTLADSQTLAVEDYDYVQAHVAYRVVRKWAQEMQKRLVDAAAPMVEDDEKSASTSA